jgi:hypothetical protein
MKKSNGRFYPVTIRRIECASGERFTFSEAQRIGEPVNDEQSSSRSKDCSSITRKRALRPSVASGISPNDSLVRELYESVKPQAPKANKVLHVYKSNQASSGSSPKRDKLKYIEVDSKEQVFASDPNTQQTTTSSFQDHCQRYYKNTSKPPSKKESAVSQQHHSSSPTCLHMKSSFISNIVSIHGNKWQGKPVPSRLTGTHVDSSTKSSKRLCRASNSPRYRIEPAHIFAPANRTTGEKSEAVSSFKDFSAKLADRIYAITKLRQTKAIRRNCSSDSRRNHSPCGHSQVQTEKLAPPSRPPTTVRLLSMRGEQQCITNRDPSCSIRSTFTPHNRSPLVEVKESLQAVYRRKQPLLSSRATDLASQFAAKKFATSSKDTFLPSDFMMLNLGRLKRLMVKLRSDKENTAPSNTEPFLAMVD